VSVGVDASVGVSVGVGVDVSVGVGVSVDAGVGVALVQADTSVMASIMMIDTVSLSMFLFFI
jgi:hypothetical protein